MLPLLVLAYVVQGYVQLLDEGVYGALSEQQRGVLQTLRQAAQGSGTTLLPIDARAADEVIE